VVKVGVQLLEQARVDVQLVIDLERDIPLSVDGMRQKVELAVLFCKETSVITRRRDRTTHGPSSVAAFAA
jgi:hypothetical protein